VRLERSNQLVQDQLQGKPTRARMRARSLMEGSKDGPGAIGIAYWTLSKRVSIVVHS
jgi:hypothetical protein